ncbi:Ribonuclease, Rne/Rng family OS=Tsukamurella paurometabola (strain ATCC 8368 / DSM / CCUG 35730/ CIP 100753 / JCM 10117 / KCTC 9821 / NBRC 16120 / NCIMB 702349 / NCTC 13040) OX=521096 GN=Tpau_1472 PE=4 SV=1 [Tsukamurella paurometabola]|uniref:Ribonuclease E n=1 Tax=Tsukamurella paurometabola (strain ATCC 8368 / DSM 20162 / CCUG 35730 / CIP 100753 / JCM 10117 / KCTC 9821 / NBRC 16120 / NCIMB 702349 / NCTC 13040) TaxID=521096 RepID=D5UXK7_TSUPD|nr:translation initiation factor IF-2 N-terminal domain-containing protein [Tsukamurella paurometabola]ADG78099.1 ribonuclease, Rne/Rng family [Tsukamurella paurometabola DSM 20162]SUP30173.1 Ribonuclease G [Tsukamurella paurometabola]
MADTPSPEEQNNEAREEFPQKLRVHALARLLGLTSKEVLAHLGDLGFVARSAHSSIDRSAAERVRDRIAELAAAPDGAATPEAPAETEASHGSPAETPAPADETPSLFSALAAPAPAAESATTQAVDTTVPLFLQPEADAAPRRRTRSRAKAEPKNDEVTEASDQAASEAQPAATGEQDAADADAANGADATEAQSDAPSGESTDDDNGGNRRRRRGRRGRGRGRGENADEQDSANDEDAADATPEKADQPPAPEKADGEDSTAENKDDESEGDDVEDVTDGSSRRRRRRRRRRGGGDDADSAASDDPPNTVVHEREPRQKSRRDEVRGISGSTRLEAKRQRRRDGRDTVRRRPPILTESEFLARREAVDRVMVVRERTKVGPSEGQDGHTVPHPQDYTQVAVLEDGVLVEHFVTSSSSASMVGNIYLGRVQNVLPSMEAAFVDIGRGRNGVLYAGEVNWDAAGLDGNARKIEQALKPGDQVLVQVSKDPVGHKGARLTTQISLAGRFLVYVPGGGSAGISRKLPDTERKRLKEILKEIVPADAGVIIRTASEGVSAEELAGDVSRLQAQWAEIEEASKAKGVRALYEEPDLLVKVVRDLFNEDFSKLVIEGGTAWGTVEKYVSTVAPDLMPRVERFEKRHADAPDVFAAYRIDEQLAKALDRKVWLPSGGTLVIDRTEAMTVVDVNTGKFTGSGGNLEETVTRNNLEAAEEIVRQMRLRDIGGMIVVDFIDMVLESNRDLVLRRLTEALGRDRTRHQVSEVTSLGLVQMTRKRIGTGLVEAFSTPCQACSGRGIIIHADPVETAGGDDSGRSGEKSEGSRKKRKRSKSDGAQQPVVAPKDDKAAHKSEHPMFKAMAQHHDDEDSTPVDGAQDGEAVAEAPADAGKPAEQSTEPTQEPKRERRRRREPKQDAPSQAATIESAPTETAPAPQAAAESTPAAPVAAEPAAAEPASAVAPSAPRRRRVARKAPTTTSAAAQTIVVDLAQEAPGAPAVTAPAADGAGETAAEPARKRARRRAAARPAGPAAGGSDTADKTDQPV